VVHRKVTLWYLKVAAEVWSCAGVGQLNDRVHVHTGTTTVVHCANVTHTYIHTPVGTTRVSRYQKGKTDLDFTEARDSE